MSKIILRYKEIQKITSLLGKKLTRMFQKDELPPLFIGVLKGAVPFFIDVIKETKIMLETDYMQYSSYGNGTKSGKVILKKDIDSNIEGRNVVIFEDILDTGKTLFELKTYLQTKNPKRIYIATLLNKPCRREVEINPDFVGKEIGDYFVVGYGLDYGEFYRNSKDIIALNKTDIKKVDELVNKIENKR